MPELSVVIANRDEPLLSYTVGRVRSTADCDVEIIVVDDGSVSRVKTKADKQINLPGPVGLAYCRDLGIQAASSDKVLVLDAHMNFHEDDHWASRMSDWMGREENFKKLACPISVVLDSEPHNSIDQQMDMSLRRDADGTTAPRSKNYGAVIHDFAEKALRPLASKWHGAYRSDLEASGEHGCEIQSILGGAYLLHRDWYNQLGAPWQYNLGWGTSEQTLSIVNWLLGGQSWLLPIEVGHQYREGKQSRVPYRVDGEMLWKNEWNRWKLIHMLPMSDRYREAYRSALIRSKGPGLLPRMEEFEKSTGAIAAMREHLAAHSDRTLEDYFGHWGTDTSLLEALADGKVGCIWAL